MRTRTELNVTEHFDGQMRAQGCFTETPSLLGHRSILLNSRDTDNDMRRVPSVLATMAPITQAVIGDFKSVFANLLNAAANS